jgi:CheY-like chemotaxis protein
LVWVHHDKSQRLSVFHLYAEGQIVSLDDVSKLVDILAKLLGVIVWPIVIIYVLARFGRGIGDLISSLTEFSIKGAGFEASGKRAEIAANLGQASAKSGLSETGANDVAQVVGRVTPLVIRQAAKSRVLWVDDHPENNVYERRSLEALGVRFVLAKSTEGALERIREQSFDAIISDMGRGEDTEAGFTLLDKLHSAGNNTPFIIYAGTRAVQLRSKALQKGALGSTNNPVELFELTLAALRGT